MCASRSICSGAMYSGLPCALHQRGQRCIKQSSIPDHLTVCSSTVVLVMDCVRDTATSHLHICSDAPWLRQDKSCSKQMTGFEKLRVWLAAHLEPWLMRRELLHMREMPKSASLVMPERERTMLNTVRSRWMMVRLCSFHSASASWHATPICTWATRGVTVILQLHCLQTKQRGNFQATTHRLHCVGQVIAASSRITWQQKHPCSNRVSHPLV